MLIVNRSMEEKKQKKKNKQPICFDFVSILLTALFESADGSQNALVSWLRKSRSVPVSTCMQAFPVCTSNRFGFSVATQPRENASKTFTLDFLLLHFQCTQSLHHLLSGTLKMEFERVRWCILVNEVIGRANWKPACFTRSSCRRRRRRLTLCVGFRFTDLFFLPPSCRHDLKCVQPEWINWSIHDFKFVPVLRLRRQRGSFDLPCTRQQKCNTNKSQPRSRTKCDWLSKPAQRTRRSVSSAKISARFKIRFIEKEKERAKFPGWH